MSDEQTAQATETAAEDVGQAPAELDPYFVKDGKAYTGAGEPVEVPPEAAKPDAKAEPKPDAAKADKPKSIGEAWKEIRQVRKDLSQQHVTLQEQHAQIQAARAELEQQQKLMKSDFRGFLKAQGLSLRDLIESDLKESDQDPRDKALAEYKRELDAQKQALEELRAERQKQAEQATATQEHGLIVENAKQVAEEYPRVAAHAEKWATRMRDHWYAHKQATGQTLTWDNLFSHFEQEMAELGVAAPNPQSAMQGLKKPAPPARGKGAVKPAEHADGDTDDGNGADAAQSSTLTNRDSALRASGGRKLTREERARLAASQIKFHS